MKRLQQGSVSRARWAAIGAAVAVSLGVGGIAVTNAAVSTGERTAFIPITPCRLFDTRPSNPQIGPRATPLAAHEVYAVQVTGANGNCTIPADASAVAMNVTTVDGTGSSFLTIWPADVAQPQASSLNWVPGSPPTPNKVDVKLSATGGINLYNDVGSVNVLADVVGYYADHNHDDRYYTKAQINGLPASSVVAAGTVAQTERSVVVAEIRHDMDGQPFRGRRLPDPDSGVEPRLRQSLAPADDRHGNSFGAGFQENTGFGIGAVHSRRHICSDQHLQRGRASPSIGRSTSSPTGRALVSSCRRRHTPTQRRADSTTALSSVSNR